MWRKLMIGIGYRRELAEWVRAHPSTLSCLELTAEHFPRDNHDEVVKLAGHYHLFVHGLGLSLGTPGPMDKDRLKHFANVARAANADWVSEHIAFSRTAQFDLGHLNPVRPTRAMAKIIADHAREVSDVCQRPMILENITSHIHLEGDLHEPDFLNRICAMADCGLLIDVTNLYINSRNHGYDALKWLEKINPNSIVQLHVVGYSIENGRLTDNHAMAVQEEIIELAQAVINHSKSVKAVILERDAAFPGSEEMITETSKLARLFARN
jgi:uncharacterized protein (UPF0276 family)